MSENRGREREGMGREGGKKEEKRERDYKVCKNNKQNVHGPLFMETGNSQLCLRRKIYLEIGKGILYHLE